MGFLRCIIYLTLLSFISFLVGRILPKSWFQENVFLYRAFPFENEGRIYEKLHIRKWQNKLLDMSRIFPMLMPAKKMNAENRSDIFIMIRETRIAEFTHMILGISGFLCLFLWRGAGGMIVSLLYCIGNIPFIMIQRYNRPRLEKVQRKQERHRNKRTC